MAAEPTVPVSAVRDLVRQLHSTASQEAAAARIALAVWRRAVARGDAPGAENAAAEAVARFESLFDQLAAVETEGKRLIAEASGPPTDSGEAIDPG
jgi:hypothetical protein